MLPRWSYPVAPLPFSVSSSTLQLRKVCRESSGLTISSSAPWKHCMGWCVCLFFSLLPLLQMPKKARRKQKGPGCCRHVKRAQKFHIFLQCRDAEKALIQEEGEGVRMDGRCPEQLTATRYAEFMGPARAEVSFTSHFHVYSHVVSAPLMLWLA